MIRINEIKLPLDAAAEQSLYPAAAKALKIDRKRIQSLEVVRKSIDSRKKEEGVFFVYSVDVSLDRGEEELLARQKGPRVQPSEPYRYEPPRAARNSQLRPVVVGLGPAGLFAALTLARAGYRPLVLERGRDVDTRTQDVKDFWRTRTLDESSNVQFGEGGAGTSPPVSRMCAAARCFWNSFPTAPRRRFYMTPNPTSAQTVSARLSNPCGRKLCRWAEPFCFPAGFSA